MRRGQFGVHPQFLVLDQSLQHGNVEAQARPDDPRGFAPHVTEPLVGRFRVRGLGPDACDGAGGKGASPARFRRRWRHVVGILHPAQAGHHPGPAVHHGHFAAFEILPGRTHPGQLLRRDPWRHVVDKGEVSSALQTLHRPRVREVRHAKIRTERPPAVDGHVQPHDPLAVHPVAPARHVARRVAPGQHLTAMNERVPVPLTFGCVLVRGLETSLAKMPHVVKQHQRPQSRRDVVRLAAPLAQLKDPGDEIFRVKVGVSGQEIIDRPEHSFGDHVGDLYGENVRSNVRRQEGQDFLLVLEGNQLQLDLNVGVALFEVGDQLFPGMPLSNAAPDGERDHRFVGRRPLGLVEEKCPDCGGEDQQPENDLGELLHRGIDLCIRRVRSACNINAGKLPRPTRKPAFTRWSSPLWKSTQRQQGVR